MKKKGNRLFILIVGVAMMMSALVIYLLREPQILGSAKPVASVEGWLVPGLEGVSEPTIQPPYLWIAENEILAFMKSGNEIHGHRTRIKEFKSGMTSPSSRT